MIGWPDSGSLPRFVKYEAKRSWWPGTGAPETKSSALKHERVENGFWSQPLTPAKSLVLCVYSVIVDSHHTARCGRGSRWAYGLLLDG